MYMVFVLLYILLFAMPTGEEPIDPSIGFLPPNNITTGQGYVTFSVFVEDSVSDLARIDAEASIIFDANEPIDTPPIFNTVGEKNVLLIRSAIEKYL